MSKIVLAQEKMITNAGEKKKELDWELSGRVMLWNNILMRNGMKAPAYEESPQIIRSWI